MSGPSQTPFKTTVNKIENNIVGLKKLLIGRTLTIIDASIHDAVQRKAMKDLILDAYWHSEERWTENILGNIHQLLKDNTKILEDSDEELARNKNLILDDGIPCVDREAIEATA